MACATPAAGAYEVALPERLAPGRYYVILDSTELGPSLRSHFALRSQTGVSAAALWNLGVFIEGAGDDDEPTRCELLLPSQLYEQVSLAWSRSRYSIELAVRHGWNQQGPQIQYPLPDGLAVGLSFNLGFH